MDKTAKIRPDFDTDVLWRPPRFGNRMRTVSTDSTTSESDSPSASSGRRFSFTEMLAGPFMHRKTSMSESDTTAGAHSDLQKKASITDNVDFKEFMRRQKKILEEN